MTVKALGQPELLSRSACLSASYMDLNCSPYGSISLTRQLVKSCTQRASNAIGWATHCRWMSRMQALRPEFLRLQHAFAPPLVKLNCGKSGCPGLSRWTAQVFYIYGLGDQERSMDNGFETNTSMQARGNVAPWRPPPPPLLPPRGAGRGTGVDNSM